MSKVQCPPSQVREGQGKREIQERATNSAPAPRSKSQLKKSQEASAVPPLRPSLKQWALATRAQDLQAPAPLREP